MNKNQNILLVEDNPGDVLLIQEHLNTISPKYHLTVKSDGDEAISYLSSIGGQDTAPHLILLDLNLPKRDGIEVLKQIKENDALKSIPVVMLTSSTLREDIERAYKAAANSYIVKPLDFDEFSMAIRNVWQFWFSTASLPNTNKVTI